MNVVILTPSSPQAQPLPAGPPQTVRAPQRSRKLALVFPVVGAPGDGPLSLGAAMRDRLAADGIEPASDPGENVYPIRGTASLSSAGWRRQSISLDWQVLDPSGKRLGTVHQLRVMDQTRHRQVNTLKGYDRRAKAFKQHAGEAFL
jgi:hypothetical protein